MQITGWLTVMFLTLALAGCNQASEPVAPGPKVSSGDKPAPQTNPKTSTDATPKGTTPVAQVAAKDGTVTQGTEKTTEKTAEKTKDEAKQEPPRKATAVFAGGCFWCVEAVFEELDGVYEVVSGYAGGTKETAHYDLVSTGSTEHAEVVQIIYDPSKITFEKLLAVHFATHDPTTLNRQGHDIGPQYRSSIFYASEEEKKTTEAMIERLTEAKAFPRKIVTILEPLTAFYPAEKYHQNYVCDNPLNGYVRNVAMPKVEKVREKFKEDLKKK